MEFGRLGGVKVCFKILSHAAGSSRAFQSQLSEHVKHLDGVPDAEGAQDGVRIDYPLHFKPDVFCTMEPNDIIDLAVGQHLQPSPSPPT